MLYPEITAQRLVSRAMDANATCVRATLREEDGARAV